MKKDMIFFSPDGQGLTSTSANHIANLAKEMIRGIETSLDATVLYSTSVSLIGTASADRLVKGATPDDLRSTAARLHSVAEAKSLIAWLREAIKAKERLLKEAEAMTLGEYAGTLGIELPEEVKKGHAITEDEYYASLSLDERNSYYETETLAAVLGKAIHPGGCFADARDALDRHIQTPREVKGDGRDTLIYSFEPTVEQALVDEVYFQLQKQYREAQARVNSYKYACQRAVKESEVAVETKYAEELDEYNKRMRLLHAQRSAYIKERVREIGDYKILIPRSLKGIFDEVSRLGKQ